MMVKALIFVFLFAVAYGTEADHFLDVESFMKWRASEIGIYKCEVPKNYRPPVYYADDQLVTVHIKGKKGGIEVYKIYDPEHQLMDGQDFKPKDKPQGGTRTVGFYKIGKETRLCLKQYPEMPANEFAVYELYKALFYKDSNNIPLPASETFLMNGQVFLLTQFMVGESLDKVSKKAESDPHYSSEVKIDIENFQRLVLLCLLTNPEDCRLQNCLFDCSNGKYRFVLIDNDRSFCKEETKNSSSKKPCNVDIKETRVHCVLFGFRELLEKHTSICLPRSCRINSILQGWEEKCLENEQYLKALSSHTKNSPGVDLTASIAGSPIASIKKKLPVIRKLLEKEAILAEVLQVVMPQIGHLYLSRDLPCKGNNLKNGLARIILVDAGRSGETTPPSASIPTDKWKLEGEEKTENGSCYRSISTINGKAKTKHIEGHYRNGTYVKSHWRS